MTNMSFTLKYKKGDNNKIGNCIVPSKIAYLHYRNHNKGVHQSLPGFHDYGTHYDHFLKLGQSMDEQQV